MTQPDFLFESSVIKVYSLTTVFNGDNNGCPSDF